MITFFSFFVSNLEIWLVIIIIEVLPTKKKNYCNNKIFLKNCAPSCILSYGQYFYSDWNGVDNIYFFTFEKLNLIGYQGKVCVQLERLGWSEQLTWSF